MAPSRKSRREKTCPPETPVAWTLLPADILLEIVARFDLRTFVRCAATCKVLRRDLLSPPFIRRVSQAAPCILANLRTDAKKPLALVHPATPAASYFCNNHLSRFLLRKDAGTLLGQYEFISSHRGLVVLRRLNINNQSKSDRCSDLCVYDPMSGARTLFSYPPEIRTGRNSEHKYVVLTAADGIIDNSLMLIVLDFYYWDAKVHTASSCGTWETVTYGSDTKFPWQTLTDCRNLAILCGGIIHWLLRPWLVRTRSLEVVSLEILSYDLSTGKTGSMKLPPGDYNFNQLHLATSSDIKLLKLLAIQGFMMFVWIKHPVSVSVAAGGSGWSLETVINMEEKMLSLQPDIGPDDRIEFEGSGNRTGDVVFLVIRRRGYSDTNAFILFDLETKEMHRKKRDFPLLEIDLPSRLQTMKIFS